GIRIALGADRGAVMRMILREAAGLLGIGLAIGAAMSLVVARAASALLFGVKPGDPGTLAGAAAILAAVALMASYVPARPAEILGVSRRTVYNRIREGRLQTIRTRCGSQRVLLESVEALLREMRGATARGADV